MPRPVWIALCTLIVAASPLAAGAAPLAPSQSKGEHVLRQAQHEATSETRHDRTTICSITVNSPDERDVMRQSLPADRYEFVELVERGRPDWLRSACQRQVRCDVLVVSGHFAGTEFYSSKPDKPESLPIAEMERAICSESCPGLFSQLKEVYLFGCDTLKPEAVRSATPEVIRGLVAGGLPHAEAERIARTASERHGESSRVLMRGLFAGVPVIYGFSSLAPYGAVAGPMLKRFFQAEPEPAVGSGQVNARLLALFGPASMVATRGMGADEPYAQHRRETCRVFDERLAVGEKIADIHRVLASGMVPLRMSFDRVERFFAALDAASRAAPDARAAMARLVADDAARASYLGMTRATRDPALRVRMVALARTVGWLGEADQREELALAIRDLMASGAMGYSEVDLVCGLNEAGELDAYRARLVGSGVSRRTADAAALACLGSGDDRARVLRALASADEDDVQVAHAYLRKRPVTEATEVKAIALQVAQMKGGAAQARALAALARLPVADAEVFATLRDLYARTPSTDVQRAVAEVFLRAGTSARETPQLAATLRKHRRKAGGGADVVDALLQRLD